MAAKRDSNIWGLRIIIVPANSAPEKQLDPTETEWVGNLGYIRHSVVYTDHLAPI
jgi:hypothetical protein